jgi:ketosteroid isomerase-like protein
MTNEDELPAASDRFYAAVRAVLQGDARPMLAVWSHREDASYCDTRGEIVRGWPALEAYWMEAAAINAAASSRPSASGQMVHSVVNGNLAYVVALEEVRNAGGSNVMRARATFVYRWEADGVDEWRLLHRHADAAPRQL